MFGRLQSLLKRESRPPSSRDAAERAVVLKIVINFAMHRASSRVAEYDGAKWYQVAKEFGVQAAVSPQEKMLLNDPAESLNKQALIDASWRVEALGTILWALKLIPWLPPYDEQCSHQVADKIPGQDGIAEFLSSVSLRGADKLSEARRQAEMWHWRYRTRQGIEMNLPFREISSSDGKVVFRNRDEIVRFTAKLANKKSGLEIIDEDFAARGKAYRDLTAKEWGEVGSIARERHFALNWLCGYAPGNSWDETPTGT